jgi:hypothetical protein
MVHAFFDRFENVCPRYVSRVPAMLIGLIVFNVLVMLLLDSVVLEKRLHSTAMDPTLRMRWVLMLVVIVGGCGWVAGKVQEKMYMVDSLKVNKDHFALAFWLGEYAKRLK